MTIAAGWPSTAQERPTTGTITRIVADRGFGFVKGDDGTDYFFHRQEVGGGLDFARLKSGDRVAFEKQQGPKGPGAGHKQSVQHCRSVVNVTGSSTTSSHQH